MTKTSGVGLSLDKTYGLQRFVVNASVTRDSYDPFDNLDYTSRRLTAAYYWKVTPSISGDFLFDHNQSPTDYEFTNFVTRPNPHRTQTTRFDLDVRAEATLHPRASLYRIVDRTSTPTFQVASTEANGGELSLIYGSPSGSSAALYADAARGKDLSSTADPVLLINPEYAQREYGIRGTWNYSGLTKGDAQLGYTRVKYDTFAVRDFGGLVGHLNATYELTGKTQLQLTASRALYASQTSFSSDYSEETGTAALAWSVTGKITIKPTFTIRRQEFRGSPFVIARDLVETTRYGYLQVDWAAMRALDVSLQLGRSSRTSSEPSLQFVDRNAAVFARFKF